IAEADARPLSSPDWRGESDRAAAARLPHIGEIQVADVPGRCELGAGEINYPNIARALKDMGYRGPVGMEAFASGDDVTALERFRAAFSRDDRLHEGFWWGRPHAANGARLGCLGRQSSNPSMLP